MANMATWSGCHLAHSGGDGVRVVWGGSVEVVVPVYHKRSTIAVGREALWAFHVRPGAFARLIPPWQDVSVASAEGGFANLRVKLVLKLGPLRKAWIAQHEGYVEGERFVDRQVTGPFGKWVHTHVVEDAPGGGAVLDDRVEYAAPGGAVGQALLGWKLASDVERIFAFRHARTRMDCVRHARFASEARMRVGVSGSSGLIGRDLCAYLANAGHRVDRIVRAGAKFEAWAALPAPRLEIAAEGGGREAEAWEGLDAAVHLGGVNLAEGRWSERRKREIVRSRVESTRLVAERVAGMRERPRVLVVASGTGGYRARGADEAAARETEELDDSFLADVVRQWEASAKAASEAGIRVVFLRMGVVMSGRGGALAAMRRAAMAGGAGTIGGGAQRWSWIAMDDVVGAVEHVLHTEALSGAVNVVSPEVVTQREFAQTLRRVVGMPLGVPLAGWMARAGMGEMSDVLLRDNAASAEKLVASGFVHELAGLEGAMRMELGRVRRDQGN